MAYGVKYQIRWQTVTADFLRFEILEKDYEGNISELTGAGNVCSIAYESGDDKIINAFKPSKCTITYRNEAATPLRSFYSEDDEKYKGQLIDENDESVRWAGFLVQDDCRGKFLDPPYPVTLVFTDNLGLLKNIPFNEAYTNFGYDSKSFTGIATAKVVTIAGVGVDPELVAGDMILIDGVEYEITGYTYFGPPFAQLSIFLLNNIPVNGVYNIIFPDKSLTNTPVGKITLWTFIRTALRATGVKLPIRVYNTLYETTHDDTKNMFDQVRVFTGKWLNEDGTWRNIYTIVEEILTTYHATLIQADGFWNIVRWAEARRTTDNNVEAIEYDENFTNPFILTVPLNYDVITPETDVEMVGADAEDRILRPFKNVMETFNYQQPRELIRNLNLRETGELLNEYTDGDFTVREYEAPFWTLATASPGPPDIFIRVITDAEDVEQERYLVLKGGSFGGAWFASEVFLMNEKDRININMSFRTSDSQTGPSNNVFAFNLIGETDLYRVNQNAAGKEDGTWDNTGAAIYSYASTQNLNEWTSWQVNSLGVPFDGYFQIGLNQLDFDGTINETHYKDITIEYKPYINDSTKITGHRHTDSLPNEIKNNYDEEITLDDSPKNAVEGALFRDQLNWNNRYDVLTTLWGYKGETKNQRLGQIITKERHTLARQARTLIDGAFVFDCPLLTTMNIIFISAIIELNFIFGVCEFDMMNMRCSTTLWELHETDEPDLTSDYEFKYLYQTN